MSDPSSFDLSSATAMLLVVVMIAVAVCVTPALLHMVFQVLPGILVLWLIVAVLRSMVKKWLG